MSQNVSAGEDGAEAQAETPCLFFTQAEYRFVEAAVARLIPSDDLGPGAREAGVAAFIDRQLAASWGTHDRTYRMGPWMEGTPEQGYQLPLTPRQIYRAGIRETDAHCKTEDGLVFFALSENRQEDILIALDEDRLELASMPASVFFNMLWRNTQEGFFSDPLHGGNRDKIGWKLIGFPGVASADYGVRMTEHQVPYQVEPVSILDVIQKRVEVDQQGYPIHVPLAGKGDAT